MTIRFQFLSTPGRPADYNASVNLGAEPSQEEVQRAAEAVATRVREELEARGDFPEGVPCLFMLYLNKTWLLHLLVRGQSTTEESK